MKTEAKRFIKIFVLEVSFWLIAFLVGVAIGHIPVHKKHAKVEPQCQALKAWYDSYNDLYFDGHLPKDAVIDYGEYSDDDIASTFKMANGQFHIAFNQNYAASARVAHIFLLHEMCHVQTWGETPDHGPQWRTCMLTIEWLHAYRGLLIDGYTESDNADANFK